MLFLKSSDHGGGESLELEAMARGEDRAEAMLDAVRRLMHEHNVYRAGSLSSPRATSTTTRARR